MMFLKTRGVPSIQFVFFTLLGLATLFPFFCLFLASFKPASELLRYGLNLKLQADVLTLDNYVYLMTGGTSYLRWYGSSIFITVVHTALCLFLSSVVGYALAVYSFRGRNVTFLLVLFVLMLPVEIMILPLYKLLIGFQMIDSYRGVILPFVVSPFAIFFFRQYASGLPKDYLDSGRVDGCSEFGLFLRIMVPLMAPAFGAMAILQALNSWNNFLWPLIVLRTDAKFTLPIGLFSMMTPYGNNYQVLLAGSVLSVVPVLVLFFFFQRYFISGLTLGGVKG
ncbi:carbohydrate ABC transporter permease [Paenibacillus sp.]|uniref:carbohydrate ABC transporter permease n=1 Tax=Paenibacillus sp. TaxID=58172 RepID=UPI002D65CEAF|nr:carbohydrate ABC transporter permease [Paenibacillus sp.]HZG83378.1 carbohydrate ABC transporter permease [Paenibacillus sp.]